MCPLVRSIHDLGTAWYAVGVDDDDEMILGISFTFQQSPGGQQQQGHGEFRHAISGNVWGIAHTNVSFLALLYVNMFETHRHSGHHTKIRT